ncbi:hypothetical protein AX15_000734 [Amanita polypyramis BW_CC]|nr:hypothetical protein AX15_000734 [Amanita polypyramis BW_CC]
MSGSSVLGMLVDKRDPAPQPVPPVHTNQWLLLQHLDIFIAALIGFIALLRLPRALARLWKKSELTNGHFLRCTSGQVQDSATPVDTAPSSPIKESQWGEFSMPNVRYNQGAQRPDGVGRSSPPPHVPAYPAFLRPLARVLRLSIIPGYSNFQIMVMLVYLGTLLYGFSYRSSFWKNPKRSGMLAASQLPFVYAFAAKNNVPGWLFGVGYESLNFFHRYVGRLVVLAANVHAIGFFYKWSVLGTASQSFKIPYVRWGLVTLICLDVLFVFSLPVWRKKGYNIFRLTHYVGYLLIVPAVSLHQPSTLPFIIVVSVLYLLDHVLSLCKTRIVTATIRPIPSLSATRIEIRSINRGWRAGQHVRVRVISASLGWLGWMESHPFTIANAPASDSSKSQEGLILICKKVGGWTNRLFEAAKVGSSVESTSLDGSLSGRTVKLLIEGPYGGPGHAIFASYSAVVLVIGGSGITFALSVIEDLVQKSLDAESNVKVIELIWMIQNPDAMTTLLPLFTSLAHACPYLSILIHYTRAQALYQDEKNGTSNGLQQLRAIPPGLSIAVHPGRPGRIRLLSIMENAITRTTAGQDGAPQSATRGMLVGVCGPQRMNEDVTAAVNGISSNLRTQIGGVEMHQEAFGF